MLRNIPDRILYILYHKSIILNHWVEFCYYFCLWCCGPVAGPPLMLQYSYFTLYMAYNFLYISLLYIIYKQYHNTTLCMHVVVFCLTAYTEHNRIKPLLQILVLTEASFSVILCAEEACCHFICRVGHQKLA